MTTKNERSAAAAALGSARSKAKTAAARENGKRGGRPPYEFTIRDEFNGDRKISSHHDLTAAAKAIDKLEREFQRRNPGARFTLKIVHADGRKLDAEERAYVSAVEDGDAA